MDSYKSPPHSCHVQLRYRKDKLLSKIKPCFPVVNEVKDLSNGCAIAAVIHYYCPGLLRLEGKTSQLCLWITFCYLLFSVGSSSDQSSE